MRIEKISSIFNMQYHAAVKIRIVILLSLVFLTTLTQAGGFLVISNPTNNRVNIGMHTLQSISLKVETNIDEQIAITKIDQVFLNKSSRDLEGYFLFPIPKGSMLRNFSMDINGKQTKAELLDAKKARMIYEDIVRRMKDPALLEYAEQGLFRVRIFPIEAGKEKHIKISYSQELNKDDHILEYIFPLNTKKYSPKPLKDMSIKINIKSKYEIKTVYSPTHETEIIRKDKNKVLVGYEANNLLPDSDFKLYIGHSIEDIGLGLLTYKKEGEDGFFFIDISPVISIQIQNI